MALADQLAVSILGDIGNLSAGMDKAASKVGAFGKKVEAVGKRMSSVGKKMSMAITLPLLAFGAMAVKFGSDAEEIQSKFDAVFKQTAGVVTDWIDEFASQVGRSKTALKDYAATFQDTFVPLGFAREEAAKLSTRLVELTIDLASFQNMSEPEVMRSLQSAIVGNHETVRRFGVIISQATLDIELMNMGIKDGVKAATEAEKAQARLNLILAGTVDAQGDAIKTAGTFAGRMRALKSDFRDLFEEISKHIIPVLVKIIEKVRGVIGYFKDLDFDTQRLIMGFALVAAAMGPVLLIIGKVITILPALSKAMLFLKAHPVFIALAALALAIGFILTHLEEFKEGWEKTWEYIKIGTEKFINGIITALNWLIDGINLLINTINLIPGISIPGLGAIGYVDFSAAIGDASRTVAGALDEGLGEVAADLEAGLETVATDITTELGDLGDTLETKLADTNTFLQTLGIDISAKLEEISKDTKVGLDAIADELGKGRFADAMVEVARIEQAILGAEKELLRIQEEQFEAITAAEEARRDFEVAEKEWWAAILSGDGYTAQEEADAQEALSLARARLSEATQQRDKIEGGIAGAMAGVEAQIEKWEAQLEVARALKLGIDDMLNVNIAGFFDMKASFDKGIEALEFTLGDVKLAFKDGMADLEIKIGDLTINLTKALGLLNAELLAVLLPVLGPLALIGIGIMFIFALLKNIEKVGEYIKAFLTMIFLPFIIIGKFLQGIISFFTGKSAEAGAAVVPTMQAGGIVPGPLGAPRPIIAHGGEPFGAAGLAKVINYELIGRAVAAGVYDAMMEVLSRDRGRPIILNIDGKRAAQALFQPFLLEQERRGGTVLYT